MSELADQIRLQLPEVWPDYDVQLRRSDLNSMLATAIMQGAQMVLEQARKSKFVLLQNRVSVPVVEFERLRRFVEGNDDKKEK